MRHKTVHVECSREPTPLIAASSTAPGLVTYTLDPEHYSQAAADRIGVVLDTMATNGSWRYNGDNRECATQYEVRRNHDRPSGVPVVFCNDPGWTAISVDADDMSEEGRAALERAIVAQLSGWEQVPLAA